MALTSYPNITIGATTTTLTPDYNGAIITSTYGSSVNLVVTSVLPAGLSCWIIQNGAGNIGVTAGSGATVNNIGGDPDTAGQYDAIKLMMVSDGNAVLTGTGIASIPGGASGTLQYNSTSTFGGISGWTTDGVGLVTGSTLDLGVLNSSTINNSTLNSTVIGSSTGTFSTLNSTILNSSTVNSNIVSNSSTIGTLVLNSSTINSAIVSNSSTIGTLVLNSSTINASTLNSTVIGSSTGTFNTINSSIANVTALFGGTLNGKYTVVASTSSPVTISASNSGTLYTNEGAIIVGEFDLPLAAAGLYYDFVVQNSTGIKVVANSSATISIMGLAGNTVSASSGNIVNSTPGTAIRLAAINSSQWVAISQNSTAWAVT